MHVVNWLLAKMEEYGGQRPLLSEQMNIITDTYNNFNVN